MRVTNRTEAKAAALRRDGVLSLALETDRDANARALDGAGIVIVAVKPAMVTDLLSEIRDLLEPDAIVVSVAVGVRIATMEALVPNPVLRDAQHPVTGGLGGDGTVVGFPGER